MKQSVWLDDLSRDMTRYGELRALIDRGVCGVTSNPHDLRTGNRKEHGL
jgi:transaldolase